MTFTHAIRGIGDYRVVRSSHNDDFVQLWRCDGIFPLVSGPIDFVMRHFKKITA